MTELVFSLSLARKQELSILEIRAYQRPIADFFRFLDGSVDMAKVYMCKKEHMKRISGRLKKFSFRKM